MFQQSLFYFFLKKLKYDPISGGAYTEEELLLTARQLTENSVVKKLCSNFDGVLRPPSASRHLNDSQQKSA